MKVIFVFTSGCASPIKRLTHKFVTLISMILSPVLTPSVIFTLKGVFQTVPCDLLLKDTCTYFSSVSRNFIAKNNPKKAKLDDTHKKAEGAILSDKTPANAGTRTPPTISPTPIIKPIALALKCVGTASEGITAATIAKQPIIK